MKGKSSGRQMWRCLAVGILSMAGAWGHAGAPAAGVPDASPLAHPPHNPINERAAGTTFGPRGQDAIGWNPRSFRFLNLPKAFRESQQLYRQLRREGQVRLAAPGSAGANKAGNPNNAGGGGTPGAG